MDAKTTVSEFIDGLTAELQAEDLVFPTSLNATMKIRQALNNPDISNDQVARIISAEPVLSAQVLKVCNSVMYNRSAERISELRVATLRLGFSAVRNVAISVGMKQLAEHRAPGKISERMEGLWTRSLRVAALSYVVAKNLTKLNPDSAMVAGLLHDVGRFYILNRARHFGQQLVNENALWEVVDQWHALFGTAILKKWHIAHDIRDAIRNFGIADLPYSGKPGLDDIITAAGFLEGNFIATSLDAVNWEATPPALQHLQLDLEKCRILMDETREELALILQAIA
jgi:putative nucleotidyltransferase with HDIG domain